MKNTYLFLLLVLLSCNSQEEKKVTKDSTLNQNNNPKDSIIGRGTFLTDNELEYIKTRDRYIEYFKKLSATKIDYKEIDKQNKDSLLVLEKLMRYIMKDSKVSDGNNNLALLYPDMDFGMLDGLDKFLDSFNIVGISKNLFFYYFMNNKINQLDQLTSVDLEKIFNSAFLSDAGVTDLTTIKFPSTNDIQAYGIIGEVGNGGTGGLPNYMYVLVASDKYIYLAEREINIKLEDIKECRKIWDSLISKQGDPENIYDEAAYKYCECYQERFKNEPQFDSIKHEMEEIINYIEH